MDCESRGIISVYDTRNLICEFLEVCFHAILYIREIYPPEIFHRKRHFGVPVRMSKHPEVNKYISDLIDGIRTWLRKDTVHKIVFFITKKTSKHPKGSNQNQFNESKHILERYIFELDITGSVKTDDDIRIDDLKDHFSACYLKLNMIDASLNSIPKGCDWCIALYTNDLTPLTFTMSSSYRNINRSSFVESPGLQKLVSSVWTRCNDVDVVEVHNPRMIPLKEIRNSSLNLQLYVEECTQKKK